LNFKALRWAMDMKVDIISMSWSFKKKDKDDEHTDFANEIYKAYGQNIVLFGSLTDEAAEQKASTFYPVDLPEVIKIGSATKYGTASGKNLIGNADYIFPGVEIPIGDSTENGSSIATAFASGLAALLLYCMEAHLYSIENVVSQSTKEARLNKAKERGGMKRMFNILSGKEAHEAKPTDFYVRPSNYLPPTIGDKRDEKASALRTFVEKLVPPDELSRG
jgi:hypothetical protein